MADAIKHLHVPQYKALKIDSILEIALKNPEV